jgi:plasmid maintenance system killer protein
MKIENTYLTKQLHFRLLLSLASVVKEKLMKPSLQLFQTLQKFYWRFYCWIRLLPLKVLTFRPLLLIKKEKYKGASAMRFDVPNGDPDGAYSGAIFRSNKRWPVMMHWRFGQRNCARFNKRNWFSTRLERTSILVDNLQLTSNWKNILFQFLIQVN